VKYLGCGFKQFLPPEDRLCLEQGSENCINRIQFLWVAGAFMYRSVLKGAIGALCVCVLPTVATTEPQPKATIETPVSGSCAPVKIEYLATNTIDLRTDSKEYVKVPQGSLVFNQRVRGCVIVQFAAVVFAGDVDDAKQRILIRAILEDMNLIAVPRNVSLSGDDDEESEEEESPAAAEEEEEGGGDHRWPRAHAMNFVFPNVPPGPHRMTLQWKSPLGGDIFMHQHTVLLHHD